jgi:hypothetical protein
MVTHCKYGSHTKGKPASPETPGAQPSASSTPPADQPKANSGNGFASPGLRTVGNRFHTEGHRYFLPIELRR